MKPQQEMSSYPRPKKICPKSKLSAKKENEESKVTVNQIVEVTDEVPLIFSEAREDCHGQNSLQRGKR